MAKKKSKVIPESPAMSAPSAVQTELSLKRDREYQIQEDANQIKRYAEVKGDKARHCAAMNRIRSEHKAVIGLDSGEDYDADEGKSAARSGKRKSTRSMSRA